MQQTTYLPGDHVRLKSGREGVLYAQTQNGRNPLGRDSSRPANWYLLPEYRGTQGVAVVSQPHIVSELDIEGKISHCDGTWPVRDHILTFEERQRVYVAWMKGEFPGMTGWAVKTARK